MNLTFKRGSKADLDNIDITPNMIYFTTDLNSHNIYMDSDGQRNKIFGFNDNDITNSIGDVSYNTFFDADFNGILSRNQVATDGETTNKQAIGIGYYNNVIGDNIRQVLYSQAPTITSSITYLQNNARSKLISLWSNDAPSNTWHDDCEVGSVSIDENFDINLSEAYLGYIILIQSCLNDTQTIYPISVFGLPQSILGNYQCYRSVNVNLEKPTEAQGYRHTNLYATLTFTLNETNNTLNIRKQCSGHVYNNTFPFHEFLIPIAVYGWRV